MKYVIELEHDDFILILETLRRAQEENVINWSATDLVCNHTKVNY